MIEAGVVPFVFILMTLVLIKTDVVRNCRIFSKNLSERSPHWIHMAHWIHMMDIYLPIICIVLY